MNYPSKDKKIAYIVNENGKPCLRKSFKPIFTKFQNKIPNITKTKQHKLVTPPTPRIIKIEMVEKEKMGKLQIDFTKDMSLLDRLFEMKNQIRIKKKTFI
jgi:hypothetical protein